MIPWDGKAMHDRRPTPGCWKDVGGEDCGEPATTGVGLCGLHLAVMQEAPVMAIPSPPTVAFLTGCGRR